MKRNVYAVMVIYNKRILDSPIYKTLLKNMERFDSLYAVVCDTSTDAEIAAYNKVSVLDGKIKYLGIPQNPGLGKAYNAAVKEIIKNECFGKVKSWDYICIFDDDTWVPDAYFDEVFETRGAVLLPIVKDDLGIMSPVKLEKNIVKRFKDYDEAVKVLKEHPGKASGINSGMVIRADIFSEHAYPEDMFMDYIDHMWIKILRKDGIYPGLLDVSLKQNFSAVTDDKAAAEARFTRQKKDLKIFYGNDRLGYYFVVLKKSIKMFLKYGWLTHL